MKGLGADSGVSYPIRIFQSEMEVLKQIKPDMVALVVGRSGTGKTTILTLEMFARYLGASASGESFHQVRPKLGDVFWALSMAV